MQAPQCIRAGVGANRTGKTELVGYELTCRAMGINPALTALTGKLALTRTPSKVWASSIDMNVGREALEGKINKFIPPGEAVFKTKDRMWVFKNGSQIVSKTCAAGWQSYQGAEVDLIGQDEEPGDERIWDEMYMRMLAVDGRILFSFTPLLGSLWLHDVLYDPESAGIDPDDVFVRQIGMIDNPHLSQMQLNKAMKRWENSPDDLRIRVLGEYVVAMGNRVFDKEKILFQRDHAREIFGFGNLVDDVYRGLLKFEPAEIKRSRLKIYQLPQPGREYAIGVDVGTGDALGDWSVCQVLDCFSREQVAMWRARVSPTELGYVVKDLGAYYNDALIAVEVNREGGATLEIVKGMGYPKIYAMPDVLKTRRRMSQGQRDDAEASAMRPTRFGWTSTQRSKPTLISDLNYALNTDEVRINDSETIMELLRYAYLKEGSRTTLFGLGPLKGHDDCVMSLGIALQAAKSVVVTETGVDRVKSAFEEETIEDLLIRHKSVSTIVKRRSDEDMLDEYLDNPY